MMDTALKAFQCIVPTSDQERACEPALAERPIDNDGEQTEGRQQPTKPRIVVHQIEPDVIRCTPAEQANGGQQWVGVHIAATRVARTLVRRGQVRWAVQGGSDCE